MGLCRYKPTAMREFVVIFSNKEVIVIKANTWIEATQNACKMTDAFKDDIISITA